MKDLFSKQATAYAAFRPTYPKELYDFILSKVKNKSHAWDCATGNGQVARDLAPHFQKVIATDISTKQIDNAVEVSNIEYVVSPAEETNFADSSFDLITVGQAVHWFDIMKFNTEAARVAKPNAIIAVWGYSLLQITPDIDKIIMDFYRVVIGSYWDPERKLIDDHYADIAFPFDEIPSRNFNFSFEWTLAELRGYLQTWSAVQKYIEATRSNPVEEVIEDIRPFWGPELLSVTFPLFLRCGVVGK